MLKLFLSTIILIASLNANSFNEKIINIIGYDEYRINKGLIDHLFSNKNSYYRNGSLNYISVIEKLKYNGLLKTGFKSPQNLSITFRINADPIKSLKIISDSLKALGYYQYATKKLVYDENTNLTWTITLKAKAAIDPLMLSKELFKHNCLLLDIKKEGYTKWMYVLNTSNSTISKAKLIIAGEKVDFRKPLKPYFIKVNNAHSVDITSKPGNQWFPYIVFYDKHLNILEIVKENKKYKKINLKVPYDTQYIKINDIYTLANLKRGLSVLIKE
jgi:hypothetical protein